MTYYTLKIPKLLEMVNSAKGQIQINSFSTQQQQTHRERDNRHTLIHNSLIKYLGINLTKEVKDLYNENICKAILKCNKPHN